MRTMSWFLVSCLSLGPLAASCAEGGPTDPGPVVPSGGTGGSADASDEGPGGSGGSSTGGTAGSATGGTGGSSTGGTGGSPAAYSHTIAIDGVKDFTAGETFATSSTGSYSAFFSWDATYLYVGMEGADVGSGSASKWVLLYVGGTPGTKTGQLYNTQQPGLPFDAKYHVRWTTANTFTGVRAWDGSSWADVTWDFTGDVWRTGTYLEMRIPLADLGVTGKVDVHLCMLNEAQGGEWTYAGAPSSSFADSFDPNYAKYFEFDLTAPGTPGSYAPLP